MAIYAVHSPAIDGDPAAAFDRSEFLRVGFSTAALVFGPFWLLAKRLWLALAAWILGAAVVGFALAAGAIDGGTALLLYGLSACFSVWKGARCRARTSPATGARSSRSSAAPMPRRPSAPISRDRWARPASSVVAPRAAMTPRGGPHVIGFFPEAGG